jgi:hypothetical protein
VTRSICPCFVTTLATDLRAPVVTLEHHCFTIFPANLLTGNLSVNVCQGLADLQSFAEQRTTVKTESLKKFGDTEKGHNS